MNQTFRSITSRPISLAFALGLLASAGCSSSSSPVTTGLSDSGVSEDAGSPGTVADSSSPATDSGASQACSDWAVARCKLFDACSGGLYVAIHWGDEATCEANGMQVCETALAAPGTAASSVTFEACAGALPTESCADFLGANPVAACAALAGSVATGAGCLTSSQCQSTYCAVPATATCGVCAAVPKAGDACTADADCGSRGGLTCASNVCVVYGAASASCSKANPCGIGLSCVGADAKKGTPGSCMTAASTVGATCDAKQATAAGCDPTLELTCDAATSQCVLNTVVASAGTCGQVNGGLAKCGASGTCEVPAATTDAGADAGDDAGAAPVTGTCLAAGATGGACDSANGPACVPPAKCVTTSDASTAGTCQAPSASACP